MGFVHKPWTVPGLPAGEEFPRIVEESGSWIGAAYVWAKSWELSFILVFQIHNYIHAQGLHDKNQAMRLCSLFETRGQS